MGHLSEALALMDRAERIDHGDSPHPRAWLALQRGLLALHRGRWDLALAHYQHALRLLPGWWLAREHVAEIHALQGQTELALQEYAAVIGDTGSPEFMDASARLLRERGDAAAAAPWIARARALYEQRLAQLPEATYGHGLDHYLQFGSPTEALALARRNQALRPNGEASIKLAAALLNAGQPAEALRWLRQTLDSGWRSAELHATAARTAAANGELAEAREQARLAKALNPKSGRQYGLPELPPPASTAALATQRGGE
jgi:tetratricopeptide (TPR) repeat protein